jgi:hypothetical protein
MDFAFEIKKLRFQSKVNKTDSCWLWTGNKLKGGYGLFNADKTRLAHRVAWFYEHKTYPTGVLRHTCDTPSCVNPAHLLDGTQQDNMNDMRAKGRARAPKGEANRQAKFTNQRVKELREEYAKGQISTAEMARREGMNQGCIWRMLKGLTYSVVKQEQEEDAKAMGNSVREQQSTYNVPS